MKAPVIKADNHVELRKFGFGFAALLWLFFWLILPWWFGYDRGLWPLIAAAVIALVAAVWPTGIYPLFRIWLPISMLLGWINTRLLLGGVYYLLMTPIGLWMYWRGKLTFQGGLDRAANSYKIPRKPMDPKSMEKPF